MSNIQLDIPNYLNVEVIHNWIPEESKILKQIPADSNYSVAYLYDDIFSFARFFNLNGKTHCSVDFQSTGYEDMIEKLIELLEDKFSF